MLFWISNRSSSKQHEIDHVRLCSDLYSTKKFTCSLFCPLSLSLLFVFLIYFKPDSCCRTQIDKLRSLPEVSPPPNSLYNLLLCSISLTVIFCWCTSVKGMPFVACMMYAFSAFSLAKFNIVKIKEKLLCSLKEKFYNWKFYEEL